MLPTPSAKKKKTHQQPINASSTISTGSDVILNVVCVPVYSGYTWDHSIWEGTGGCSRGGMEKSNLWPHRTMALPAEGWSDSCGQKTDTFSKQHGGHHNWWRAISTSWPCYQAEISNLDYVWFWGKFASGRLQSAFRVKGTWKPDRTLIYEKQKNLKIVSMGQNVGSVVSVRSTCSDCQLLKSNMLPSTLFLIHFLWIGLDVVFTFLPSPLWCFRDGHSDRNNNETTSGSEIQSTLPLTALLANWPTFRMSKWILKTYQGLQRLQPKSYNFSQ